VGHAMARSTPTHRSRRRKRRSCIGFGAWLAATFDPTSATPPRARRPTPSTACGPAPPRTPLTPSPAAVHSHADSLR
jgi:hypothetical protein